MLEKPRKEKTDHQAETALGCLSLIFRLRKPFAQRNAALVSHPDVVQGSNPE